MDEFATTAQRKKEFFEKTVLLFHKGIPSNPSEKLHENLEYLSTYGVTQRMLSKIFGVSEGMIGNNKASAKPNVFFAYAIARIRKDMEETQEAYKQDQLAAGRVFPD